MVDNECTIHIKGDYKKFTVNTRDIIAPNHECLGKIIILKEIELTRNLVTQTIGAKASLRFRNIVGQDAKFLSTLNLAKRAASINSNVLLLGESGTGKDIFAQAMHNAGPRRDGPYIAVNTGAIPRQLVASELFGYAEGAFTGSKKGGNPGKFELAHGGTIFLDEIGEMPFEAQVALLRVIEEKRVARIGAKYATALDVRIIAATNKNLREQVVNGNFREDLFYRLNVLTIELIPLRDRANDIPLLIKSILNRLDSDGTLKIDRIDDAAMDILTKYAWPGNIRELQNIIERMVYLATGPLLSSDLIPKEITSSNIKLNDDKHLNMSLDEIEKLKISDLIKSGYSKSEIARRLKIARSTLYLKVKKYDLESRLSRLS